MTNTPQTQSEQEDLLREKIVSILDLKRMPDGLRPESYITERSPYISYEQLNEVVQLFTQELNILEKAYGACHNCYGKGYASYDGKYQGGGMEWPDSTIKFCDCERGKQLEELINSKPTTNGSLAGGGK